MEYKVIASSGRIEWDQKALNKLAEDGYQLGFIYDITAGRRAFILWRYADNVKADAESKQIAAMFTGKAPVAAGDELAEHEADLAVPVYAEE